MPILTPFNINRAILEGFGVFLLQDCKMVYASMTNK